MGKLMVVEDDPDICSAIKILLESQGYSVNIAGNAKEAMEIFSSEYELLILDIMLPGMSGIELCKKIRKFSYVPVLFLTAKSADTDKMEGLSAGGDDYLVKPFSFVELIARVKALIRRNQLYNSKPSLEEESHVKWVIEGKLFINTKENEVLVENEEIPLTDLEYKILLLLVTNKTKIFSVKNIYESVWQEEYIHSSGNTVMVHIKNLRGKLDKNPYTAGSIKTIWGKGYRFEG